MWSGPRGVNTARSLPMGSAEVPLDSLQRHDPSLSAPAVGLSLAGSGLVTAMLAGGTGLSSFFDPVSLTVVAGSVTGLLLAAFGLRGTGRAFATLLWGGGTPDLAHSTAFFLSAAALSLLCGCAGSLIGLVQLLQQIGDPSALGAAAAVAMLSSLYGLMGAAGAVGGAVSVAKREPSGTAVEAAAGTSLALVGAGGIALFAVPGLTFLLVMTAL